MLHFRCSQAYEWFYAYFLNSVGEDTPEGVATILNAFSAYESAKSEAGITLSTKSFKKLNDTLTIEWQEIRKKLKWG